MQNVYQIGMHIALAGNALQGLQQISLALAGIHRQVGQIHGGWKGWAAVLGVGGIAAGAGIIGGLKTIANHGDKLIDQQVKLTNQGYKQNEILKLQADYYDRIARAVPTSTVAGFLKTTNELRSVTGPGPEGLAKASQLAEKSMKIDALLSNTFGTKTEGEYYKLLRSAEMKGIATSPEKREEFINSAISYISAFGGKLKSDDFQTFARRGGTAFMNADVQKAMGPLAVLMSDIGGSGAGTATMTLHQMVTGAHTLSKQQADTLSELGLLDMSKATKTGFGGGRLQLQPGAMVGSLEHSGDLPGWIHDVVWPAIMKAAHGDKAIAESLVGKIAPNRNAAKLIQMFGDEGFRDQIAKDMGLSAQALPWEEQYKNYIEKNPKGVKQAFHDQFESMMESIGGPLAQAAIPVMKQLTELFTDIGKWANEHPETIKMIGTALAGLAGVLVVFGTGALIAAMASFAAGGAAVVAIGGLVAGLTTLAALNWDSIKKGFETVVGWLTTLFEKFKAFVGGAGTGPTAPPGGGSYDAMGNYTPSAYHPGGANDNYSSLSGGYAGGVAGSAKGAALIARLVKEDGLTPEQAAGIVGNLGHESGGFRHFKELGGGGLGWAQWTGVRARAFLSWSKRHGLDPHSDEANWGFLHADPEWQRAIGAVRGTHSTADAMLAFEHSYERAGIKAYGSRLGHGRAALGAYSARSKKAIEEGVTPPPRKQSQPIIQFDAHLDGEVLSRTTTRRQSRMAMFPTSSGDIDPHGRYHDAGTRFSDVG